MTCPVLTSRYLWCSERTRKSRASRFLINTQLTGIRPVEVLKFGKVKVFSLSGVHERNIFTLHWIAEGLLASFSTNFCFCGPVKPPLTVSQHQTADRSFSETKSDQKAVSTHADGTGDKVCLWKLILCPWPFSELHHCSNVCIVLFHTVKSLFTTSCACELTELSETCLKLIWMFVLGPGYITTF